MTATETPDLRARAELMDDGEGGKLLLFDCPGCGIPHGPRVAGRSPWTWNGSLARPTIRPSILCKGTQRCHSWVTDGQIQFLGDCDHALAGQTVDLPEVRP